MLRIRDQSAHSPIADWSLNGPSSASKFASMICFIGLSSLTTVIVAQVAVDGVDAAAGSDGDVVMQPCAVGGDRGGVPLSLVLVFVLVRHKIDLDRMRVLL